MSIACPQLMPATQAFLDRIDGGQRLLIDGQWKDAGRGQTLATIDPATGVETAQIAAGSIDDVNQAVAAAHSAFAQWRDTPPKDHDFRLAKDKSFYTDCSEMARNRKLSPLKRAKPPKPPIKPWGVQLGFGTSKKSAAAKVRDRTGSCRAQVKREKLDLIYVKNRVSGKKGYFFARIGRNSRQGAQKLCSSLKRQRCSCLVVQNK